jgi:hypothetical protein
VLRRSVLKRYTVLIDFIVFYCKGYKKIITHVSSLANGNKDDASIDIDTISHNNVKQSVGSKFYWPYSMYLTSV